MALINKHYIINKFQSGQRLDKFISGELPEKSRSYIQNAISSEDILVNNQVVKSGYKLKENDEIVINIVEKQIISLAAEKIPLNIVFEDDYLLVINKPAGMIVHPGAGNRSGTLVNALLYHCNSLSNLNDTQRPGIVHRLDKDTSGLMVVAKDDLTHQKLQEQFDTRDIQRTYYALVWGVPASKQGEIVSLISRSSLDRKKMAASTSRGKQAITNYTLLKDFLYLSLLELTLKTGRTHQIRVHLNHINMPVFGDPVYNGRKSQLRRLPAHLQKRGMALLKRIDRQALHAKKLSFIHPTKKEKVEFECALPEDLENVINSIETTLMLI